MTDTAFYYRNWKPKNIWQGNWLFTGKQNCHFHLCWNNWYGMKVFNSRISCLTNMLDHKEEMNLHSAQWNIYVAPNKMECAVSSRRGSGCLNTILRFSSQPHTSCNSIGSLNTWVSWNIRCSFLKDSIINNTNILYFFPLLNRLDY